MATVPRFQRQISSQGLPGVNLPTQAPIEAFGGGQGLANVTQGSLRSIQAIQELALEEKTRADKLMLNEFKSNALQDLNKSLYDPKDGYVVNVKGENITNEEYVNSFRDKYLANLDEGVSKLRNREQRDQAQAWRSQLENQFDEITNKHYSHEFDQHEKKVFSSQVKNLIEHGSNNYGNMDLVGKTAVELESLIMDRASDEKMSPEETKDAVLNVMSGYHSTVIRRMLSDRQDISAKAYFDSLTRKDKNLPPKSFPGLIKYSNIEFSKLKVFNNEVGGTKTVKSMGISDDKGREILIPTVDPDTGEDLSPQEAVIMHKRTGRHLGIFESPKSADEYASKFHHLMGPVKEQLTTNDRIKLSGLVDESSIRGKAQRISNAILSKGLNETETLKEVEIVTGNNVDLRDETMRRVKQKISDLRMAQDNDYKNSVEIAYKQLETTMDPDSIDDNLWHSLKGPDKKNIIKFAGIRRDGKVEPTDNNAWYVLQNQLANPETRMKIARDNPYKYRNVLGDGDFEEFKQAQNNAVANEEKFIKDMNTFLNSDLVVKSTLEAARIDLSKPKQAQKYSSLVRDLVQWSKEKFIEDGKYPDQDAIQKRLDFLLLRTKGVRVFEIPINEKIRINYRNIPYEDKVRIENTLKVTDENYTEDDVVEAYNFKVNEEKRFR
jgi:hypothetical protein